MEETPDTVTLLQLYYQVSLALNVFALSMRYVLQHIENADVSLCELFHGHEDIGEAYIKAMDENMLQEYFERDGKLFLDWR